MDTKALMQKIRPEIDAALAEVAKRHGIQELRLGHGTYNSGGAFHFKLEGLAAGGKSVEAQSYDMMREPFQLPPLGTKFTVRGVEHTITGLNRANSVLTAANGGEYRWKLEMIRRALGIQPKFKVA